MVILIICTGMFVATGKVAAQSMCSLNPNSQDFQDLDPSATLNLYATVDDPSCINLQPGDYSATYIWSSSDGSIVNFSTTSGTTTQVTFNKEGSVTISLAMAVYSADGSQYFETYNFFLNATVLPPVSIIANSTSCTDGPQNFTSNYNGYNNVSYMWNFGDPGSGNNISANASPSHIFSHSGDFNVELTTTLNGYTSVDNMLFHYEHFEVEIGGDIFLDFNENITLNATTTNASSYAWNRNGVEVSSSPQYTISEGGLYEIFVSSVICDQIVSDQITVTKETLDLNILSDDQGTCNSATQLFRTDFPSLAGAKTYAWDFGDPASPNNTSSLADPIHTFSKSGSFNISVTVTYDGVDYSTSKIFLNRKIDVNLGDVVIKTPDQPLILETGIDNANYLWQDGSTNPTYNVISAGTYTVTVTKNGCSDTDNIDVIDPSHGPNYSICDLDLNASELENIRPGTILSFWATPEHANCINLPQGTYDATYNWSVSPSSGVSFANNDGGSFAVTFLQGGNYTISLSMQVYNAGETQLLETNNYTVNASVLSPVSILANTSSCTLGPQNFSSTYHIYDNIYDDWDGTFDNKVTYSWNFGDPSSGANNTSDLESPSHTFSDYGDFTVTVETTLNGYTTSDHMLFHYEEFDFSLGEDISLRLGETVMLDANVYNAIDHRWSGPGIGYPEKEHSQIIVSREGTYEVSFFSNQCQQSASDVIQVSQQELRIIREDSPAPCHKVISDFRTNVVYESDVSFQWLIDGMPVGTLPTLHYEFDDDDPSGPARYEVEVIFAVGNDRQEALNFVYVEEPFPDLGNDKTQVDPEESHAFTINEPDRFLDYGWYYRDQESWNILDETAPVLTTNIPRLYKVQYNYDGDLGNTCTGSEWVNLGCDYPAKDRSKQCFFPEDDLTISNVFCNGVPGADGVDWSYRWRYDDSQQNSGYPEGEAWKKFAHQEESHFPENIATYTELSIPELGTDDDMVRTYALEIKDANDFSNDAPIIVRGIYDIFYFPNMEPSIEANNGMCSSTFVARLENELSKCQTYRYHWFKKDRTAPDTDYDEFGTGRNLVTKMGDTEEDVSIKLEVTYDCGCGDRTEISEIDFVIKPEMPLIPVPAPSVIEKLQNTIQASASSFSDEWTVFDPSRPIAEYIDANPYAEGRKGIWRPESQFSFVTPRDYDTSIPISERGTFELEKFAWEDIAANNSTGTKWKRVQTITDYNGFGVAAQTRDILGRYTSALYGYHGRLPVATGQNMNREEMAFTSFEEGGTDGGIGDNQGFELGNWLIEGNGIPAQTVQEKDGYTMGARNVFQVNRSFDYMKSQGFFGEDSNPDVADRELYTKVTIVSSNNDGNFFSVKKLFRKIFPRRIIRRVNLLCAYEVDENTTNFEVDAYLGDTFLNDNIYFLKPPTAAPATPPSYTQDKAHTGKSCLEITSVQQTEQSLLKIKNGKSYMISAWVSDNETTDDGSSDPSQEITISAEITTGDASENIPAFPASPSGPVIDGWQQIELEVPVPTRVDNSEYKLTLTLTPPAGKKMYIDDLRFHPKDGNMKTYVYNTVDYQLVAELDENNFATFYEYNQERKLLLINKETEEGLRTIQESYTHTQESLSAE